MKTVLFIRSYSLKHQSSLTINYTVSFEILFKFCVFGQSMSSLHAIRNHLCTIVRRHAVTSLIHRYGFQFQCRKLNIFINFLLILLLIFLIKKSSRVPIATTATCDASLHSIYSINLRCPRPVSTRRIRRPRVRWLSLSEVSIRPPVMFGQQVLQQSIRDSSSTLGRCSLALCLGANVAVVWLRPRQDYARIANHRTRNRFRDGTTRRRRWHSVAETRRPL